MVGLDIVWSPLGSLIRLHSFGFLLWSCLRIPLKVLRIETLLKFSSLKLDIVTPIFGLFCINLESLLEYFPMFSKFRSTSCAFVTSSSLCFALQMLFSLSVPCSLSLPSPYQQLFSDCMSYGAAHFWTHVAWDSLMLWESYLADRTGETREGTTAVGTEGNPWWGEKVEDRSTGGDFFLLISPDFFYMEKWMEGLQTAATTACSLSNFID